MLFGDFSYCGVCQTLRFHNYMVVLLKFPELNQLAWNFTTLTSRGEHYWGINKHLKKALNHGCEGIHKFLAGTPPSKPNYPNHSQIHDAKKSSFVTFIINCYRSLPTCREMDGYMLQVTGSYFQGRKLWLGQSRLLY